MKTSNSSFTRTKIVTDRAIDGLAKTMNVIMTIIILAFVIGLIATVAKTNLALACSIGIMAIVLIALISMAIEETKVATATQRKTRVIKLKPRDERALLESRNRRKAA